jgi:Glutaredoxin-like domain (DUF836)
VTRGVSAGTKAGTGDDAGQFVLYVREDCHLCDVFLVELEQDLASALVAVTLVDVDSDEALALEFGLRVPVLALSGRVVCEGRYESQRVRGALQV